MKILIVLYDFCFKRLPLSFSVPMLIFAVVYFLIIFPWLVYDGVPGVTDAVSKDSIVWQWLNLRDIISALVTLAFVFLGGVLSYGLAGIGYRLWRSRQISHLQIHGPVRPTFAADAEMGERNPLRDYHAIGIILAGGGAKGAYQAGSMKAIYEFLEKHKAHHKVKMIAGTSIGSWNSLFWLADLIKGPDGGPGLHEQWWHQMSVKSVIRPELYIPMRQNYFLSNEPWQEMFDAIFIKNEENHQRLIHHIQSPDAPDAMHFYFTRSNVARAHLEFTTNRTGLSDVEENSPGGRRPRPPAPPEIWRPAKTVADIRDAVFSSMDLPPLFRYMSIGDELFEDGGVVDNLPIRFGTELEKCDLLFVLPLNASFEQAADLKSVAKRLFRVMDARQGVLERNSFKMVYLYNELAGLRQKAANYEETLASLHREISQLKKQHGDGDGVKPLEDMVEKALSKETLASTSNEKRDETAVQRAAKRRHDMVQVFAICPAPELAINTSEFWKTKEAGQAFRLMHEYTKYELERFDFKAPPDWIRLGLVSPHGRVTYLEDF